jgi:hypothetical protein
MYDSKAPVHSMTRRFCTPPLWQQEHLSKYNVRYCHILPIVLTWRQAISTCSVHSKRPSPALWQKWLTADDEVKIFVQWLLNEQQETFLERGTMKVPERWRLFTEVQGEYVKKWFINFHYELQFIFKLPSWTKMWRAVTGHSVKWLAKHWMISTMPGS